MILPLINTMTLKTGESMKIAADDDPIASDVRRPRRSPAKTGFMLLAALTVATTMLRMARRRSR